MARRIQRHSGGSDAQQTSASAELRARAAFFAWPIASAAIVRFADAKQAATLLEALRSLAAVPSRASAPPRRVPWLVLGSGKIMVVPKLGGLSDGAAFGHELDEVTLARGPEREARWIHRP